MIRSWQTVLTCFFIILIVSGCDSSSRFEDLRSQMEKYQAKVRAESKKIETATVPAIKPVSYEKQRTRSPFVSKNDPVVQTIVSQDLTYYPTSALRFVGMLKHHDTVIAVIETPDKKTHEVFIGDSIGNLHGKIQQIDTDHLVVVEPISKDDPSLGTKEVVLQLKENKS